MTRRWFSIVRVALAAALLSVVGGSLARPSPVAAQVSDRELAMEAAETFVVDTGLMIFPEWANAKLSEGEAYTDLRGNLVSYVFAVSVDGKPNGRVVVGSSVYEYGVLQAGPGPLPVLPTVSEITTLLGVQVAPEPARMYLGYDRFYAQYEVGGRIACFDLLAGTRIDLKQLTPSIASPEEYKKTLDAPDGHFQSSVLLYDNPLPVPLQAQYNGGQWPNDCGPTTGAMIGEYYKSWFSGLWSWDSDHHDMFCKMYCNNWFPGYTGTAPWNFGPGFVAYAEARGYYGWTTDWCVDGSFARIQTEIDGGRPLGLMFSYFAPYASWHWCAIKGYTGTDSVLINNPANGGHCDSISWAANKGTSVVTRIY